jgi:hypothetical protein
MDKPKETYWQLRLDDVKKALEANNFETFLAADQDEAARLVKEEILPAINPASVSWGGSATFLATGLYSEFRDATDFKVIDTYDKSLTPEEMYERRRQALLVDLFFTGTNAVTSLGQLVNLDMYGNRACAIPFGPRNVVVFAGRNKITADLDDAMFRIKNYCAPVNTMRLDKKTPCVKDAYCHDCSSKDRICNAWTITEKSFPKGRVRVILVNQDLGF